MCVGCAGAGWRAGWWAGGRASSGQAGKRAHGSTPVRVMHGCLFASVFVGSNYLGPKCDQNFSPRSSCTEASRLWPVFALRIKGLVMCQHGFAFAKNNESNH